MGVDVAATAFEAGGDFVIDNALGGSPYSPVHFCCTAIAHNKNRCIFIKGACCSCPVDTIVPWAVTLDTKNGTAT